MPNPQLARLTIVAGLLAPSATAACTEAAPAPPRGLLIAEVATDGVPHDWIEVYNATGQVVDLVDYVYVDLRGALDRARSFADVSLDPGERFVQEVSADRSGFGLAPDEEVWIYRARDGALVDGLDWDAGATPAGGSLARLGDTGEFVTARVASPDRPNPPGH